MFDPAGPAGSSAWGTGFLGYLMYRSGLVPRRMGENESSAKVLAKVDAPKAAGGTCDEVLARFRSAPFLNRRTGWSS
jgi:hypothetical protein